MKHLPWLASGAGALLCSCALAGDLPATVSWVGNTYSGRTQWVLQDVQDICVDASGTLFTNVGWDEAGGNVQEYRDGKLIRSAGHTHGWGYEGGDGVAVNRDYVFIIQNVNNEGGGLKGDSWPAKGLAWSGISRRRRADMRQPAPFAGGRGKEGDVLKGAFLPVVESAVDARTSLRGIAATDQRVYASCPGTGIIYVLDAESMQAIAQWKLERVDKLCVDARGHLWAVQRPEASAHWRAVCPGDDGRPSHTIDLGADVIATDLCVDAAGALYVSDAGPAQQVKVYQDGRLARTIGARGGILAGPVKGRFGPLRFNRPMGVGVDAAGNVYVASSGSSALQTGGGGSTVIESYTSAAALRWRVMGLHFIDSADLDPANTSALYTKEEIFTLDYARPAGEQWSYRAYTVDRFKYPDDPRLHIWSANAWLRRPQGRALLFVSDMTGEYLQVYRFNPASDGETAIPAGLFAKRHARIKGNWPAHQPDKGEWIWTDANANGAIDAGEYESDGGRDAGGIYWPDDRGDIWHVNGSRIRCLPLQQIDDHGVPHWSYSAARQWDRPTDLDAIRRVHYLADRDVLICGGNKGEDHNQHWKPMGPVLCRYDDWSKPSRSLRWMKVLPYEKGSRGHESAEPMSFDVAGEYVFVAYTRGLKEEGLKYAFVKVFRLSDMAEVGNLVCEKALGEPGLLDIVEATRAVRRADGQYVVFMEDDLKAKVVMWVWKP